MQWKRIIICTKVKLLNTLFMLSSEPVHIFYFVLHNAKKAWVFLEFFCNRLYRIFWIPSFFEIMGNGLFVKHTLRYLGTYFLIFILWRKNRKCSPQMKLYSSLEFGTWIIRQCQAKQCRNTLLASVEFRFSSKMRYTRIYLIFAENRNPTRTQFYMAPIVW